MSTWMTGVLTLAALVAFAANSVLCRMALGEESIDATTFTGLRLLSGSVALLVLVSLDTRNRSNPQPLSKGSWLSGFMLFLYAACFSYAYLTLETGVGALILFASVQITMISYTLLKGRRLEIKEWVGVLLAFAGFVYLVSPGISAPSLEGLTLMTLSGIGWGLYSVRGKSTIHPLQDTSFNFMRSLAFFSLVVILVWIFGWDEFKSTRKGVLLALTSGAITSGIGYTIWYTALRGLNNVQASVVQLAVPLIAAAGGIVLLSESLTLRLFLSSLIILGGIFLVVSGKKRN